MPASIIALLQPILSRAAGLRDPEALFIRPVGGGSINDAYQVFTKDNRRWFCKFNEASRFPGLFAKEARGLALLSRQELIRVPAVIACEEVDERQVLVLEWIDQEPPSAGSMMSQAPPTESTGSRPDAFWRVFGEQLAQLHRVTRPQLGLEENNYMGALPQDNSPVTSTSPVTPTTAPAAQTSHSWPEFFIRRRLQPQVRMVFDQGLLDTAALGHFERLYPALPDIFTEEPPALLHGDLWSGNFLCDSNRQPVLIDPAVYYGHRSMDLAMTTLFGGFEPAFYESYAYHYPFPPNYHEQWEIANLYPLLIHLNLFGKSYLGNILHTIQRF